MELSSWGEMMGEWVDCMVKRAREKHNEKRATPIRSKNKVR